MKGKYFQVQENKLVETKFDIEKSTGTFVYGTVVEIEGKPLLESQCVIIVDRRSRNFAAMKLVQDDG